MIYFVIMLVILGYFVSASKIPKEPKPTIQVKTTEKKLSKSSTKSSSLAVVKPITETNNKTTETKKNDNLSDDKRPRVPTSPKEIKGKMNSIPTKEKDNANPLKSKQVKI